MNTSSGNIFNQLGTDIVKKLDVLGEYGLFSFKVIRSVFSTRLKSKYVLRQMYKIGVSSLPITLVTLTFVGMVFTNQVAHEFTRMGAGKIIGGIVGFAVWRELGPLFAGVVVAARVGAAISTEMAAMKVSEQIDALRSMAVSPFVFLYAPRFIALIFMLPLLVVFADFVGFMAGLFIYKFIYSGNWVAYLVSAFHMLSTVDIWGGVLVKGPIFGFIIATFSLFIGSNTEAGAAGIGKSATIAVVSILIVLFIVNFFLSFLIF